MGEPEIKALIALIRCSLQVVGLLFRRHRVPPCFTLLIDMDIEQLCADKEHKVVRNDTEENLVASPIQRFVLVSINLVVLSVCWLQLVNERWYASVSKG